MKTSLIIGMGIGELYSTVLDKLGHGIITVDSNPNKKADFLTVEDAIKECRLFDTVHICTPNFTHEVIARTVAPYTRVVFIEKPGVIDSKCWQCLIEDFPRTRFMMVKNNMWRSNIAELKQSAKDAKAVNIEWTRKNCIPSPGSWFTTRELAFGGVSRDLMPHLLSLYVAMNPSWRTERENGRASIQSWLLEDIESTEYGTVNPNGTYDVDDQCNIRFGNKWSCVANWRSMSYENSAIEFIKQDNTVERFELGWCPEEAYYNMIKDAVDHIDDSKFWLDQFEIDMWIHGRIENL
jgi:predicted dehydrogenase